MLDLAEPSRKISLKDAEAELQALLAKTVELHMIADVPVGRPFSGGGVGFDRGAQPRRKRNR